MRRLAVLVLLWVLCISDVAAAAPVAITESQQREIMLTIYNGNLGLVKDTRDARFEEGTTDVTFMDVAAQIDPTSVHLRSLSDPQGLKILEQNYEYDLLTSEKLMEKYVGKKVRLYQGSGAFQEATLLSTNGPVWEINGEIHMGGYGNMVLPALPENLVSRNHKKEAVTVEVVEPVPGDWEVLRSTLPHEKVDAFTMRFRVPVPKDGEAKLTYRVRVRF
jgi:hypothetical protein